MGTHSTSSHFIKTGKHEYLKWHYEFDAFSRPVKVYEAQKECLNNGKCLVTKYSYATDESTHPENAREYESNWNSGWDLVED